MVYKLFQGARLFCHALSLHFFFTILYLKQQQHMLTVADKLYQNIISNPSTFQTGAIVFLIILTEADELFHNIIFKVSSGLQIYQHYPLSMNADLPS
jgi:hypothetical protein